MRSLRQRAKFLSGDLNPADAAQAWKSAREIDSKTNSVDHYFTIQRKHEICIVRYTYMAQFSSPLLRCFLPYPEILFLILLGIGFLLELFFIGFAFGEKDGLKNEQPAKCYGKNTESGLGIYH